MKYCPYCGSQVDDEDKFCFDCGHALKVDEKYLNKEPKNKNNEKPIKKSANHTFLWNIISIINPILGIVLFLIWKKKSPKKSKACLTGTVIGVIAWIIVFIFLSLYLVRYVSHC